MNKQNTGILVIVIILLVLLGGVALYRQHLLGGLSQDQLEQTQPTKTPEAMQSSLFKVAKSPSLGSYFTDPKGMTLYTFVKDQPNVSNCTDDCAKTWPPYLATSNQTDLPGKLGVITRADGTQQYTWNKMPLYYFSGDQKPGDTAGNNYKSLWMVAR